MSSNEEDYNDGDGDGTLSSLQGLKKRRIQRACDICRRKKSDGVQMPANRCSNCVAYNFDCSYIEAAKKRGPPKGSHRYVESLENRLDKLEKLLKKLCPDEQLLKELDASLESGILPNNLSIFANNSRSLEYTAAAKIADPKNIVTSVVRNIGGPSASELEVEDNAQFIIPDNLKRLELDPVNYRFFGKSSGAMLIHTAIELKNEYTGSNDHGHEIVERSLNRRTEFWFSRPWEDPIKERPIAIYTFPDPDLRDALVDLYFRNINIYMPLLHRPIFERSIAEDIHLSNDGFGGVLMLVCAVGARFSDDPRVLVDGEESFHSAGWKWFEQVQVVRKSFLGPPTLYDVQYYCLSVIFLQGSSAPQASWTMTGIGIRLAQDVGAHRRKTPKAGPTPEDELWKRAFWALIFIDRISSAALGRPCAIQDEDFDLEMPIECDDEYWECEDPEHRWKQPPGKPSLLTAFNIHLRLNQVLSFSLRTIYSINKSKILLGFVGQQWEQHIVSELDSALNKWVDSVPDHLRWDPTRENKEYFKQSVVLYTSYYHIQILIHRPFIPTPNKPSPLSFPSLAICTNAARSCSHVVDVYMQRMGEPLPQIHVAVFTSAIVLLLSIWGGKRSGLSSDPNKEMADVHKCMRVLRASESRWHPAGKLWDVIYELASVGELPLPQPSPPSNKRERDADTPISATMLSPNTSEKGPEENNDRPMAGSRRARKDTKPYRLPVPNIVASSGFRNPNVESRRSSQGSLVASSPQVRQLHLQPSSESLRSNHSPLYPPPPSSSLPSQPQSPSQNNQYLSLPVYSQDLGKLPLHGQIDFSSMEQPNYWYNSLREETPPYAPSMMDRRSDSGRDATSLSRPSMSQHTSSDDVSTFGNVSGMQHVQNFAMDVSTPTSNIFGQINQPHYASSGAPSSSSSYSNQPIGSSRGPLFGTDAQRAPDMIPMDRQRRPTQLDAAPDHHQYGQIPQPPSQQQYQSMAHQSSELRFSPSSTTMHQTGNQSGFVDADTIAMWSTAPTGFELDEWGSYLMSVSEIANGNAPQHSFDQSAVQSDALPYHSLQRDDGHR
ncbi:hypothetical protein FA15DRAFT_653244 [Coprinopsis marcescibilis]|uniref:Zn(2)-C6 fungal-type domain-containing protein n=1 Tax=Coprinopsis marcescibilis TaxID=230819 RepID=A0A5C3L4I5_COPMA|nr:hypothetical protein FA15DRAFT_653244 [Coprinopsis marcescibilis]